ncbi:MAG TPA: hypothetical protein VKQ29_11225 [Aliidongia sp.]|nr:hypothetical protein [Aliidongia sp.]
MTAALAVIAGTTGAQAQPGQSLTDIDELYWQAQLFLRVAPAENFCVPGMTPYTFLTQSPGRHSTTCHVPAGRQVAIPVVATIEYGTQYVAYLPLYSAQTVNAATGLSFSINGHAERVTAEWRGPTPIFLSSAIEGQSPAYTAADGYFTVRTFNPGNYTVHTTGCLPAQNAPPGGSAIPAACYDMTYQLIVR